MKVAVVTGATSMIGVATIEKCIKHGVNVYAVVRPNSKNLGRLPQSDLIHIVECELSEMNSLTDKITEKCDVFYHFAWEATGRQRNAKIVDQSKNIVFTLDAVNTARALNCKLFVGAGSQAEYGLFNEDKITPSSPINPIQPYGIAKYAAGKLALPLAEFLGMSCAWVRIFSVYGENDKSSSMLSSLIEKIRNNQHCSLTECKQRWDYLYSGDAGNAFYLIGEKVHTSKIYCLGSGTAHILKDYIEIVTNLINSDADITYGEIPYTKESVMNLCADISELTNDTGFMPKTDFKDGILNILHKAGGSL